MKQGKEGTKDTRKKQLINLPEEHKAWITRVVDLANEAGMDSNQTEVMRIIVGKQMRQDPEAFVAELSKARLKARLEEIERKSVALAEEKAQLAAELSGQGRPAPQLTAAR